MMTGMTSFEQCTIVLDKPDHTYFPGETITGRVEYIFLQPAKIRGIGIKFRGAAENSWRHRETHHSHNSDRTTETIETYSGGEEYFSIAYQLMGSNDGSISEVGAGPQCFPFTCTLPPSLPSSFEGDYGHIRYTIKVNLGKPYLPDQENKMAFTVISNVDLNTLPQCLERGNIHVRTKFCCLWCQSGPLVVDVDIPVSGYCSGQVMPIDISVENGSNVDVSQISLKLLKLIKYFCQYPSYQSKENEKVILHTTLFGVKKHSSENFKRSMAIPPLPPSNLTNCSVIDLTYMLKVECAADGCHCDVDGSHTITIGTIPIASFQSPEPDVDTVKSNVNFLNNQVSSTMLVNSCNTSPTIAQNWNNQYAQPNLQYPPQPAPYPQPGANPYGTQPAFNPGAFPQNPTNGGYPQSCPSAPMLQDMPSPQMPYPQPVYCPGQFGAKTIVDAGDPQHVIVTDFSPRYPTYGFAFPSLK